MGELGYDRSPADPFYGLPIRTMLWHGRDSEDCAVNQYTLKNVSRRQAIFDKAISLISRGFMLPYIYWKVAAAAVYQHELTHFHLKKPSNKID